MRFPRCIFYLLLVLPFGLYAQTRPPIWDFPDGGRGDDVFRRAVQLSTGVIACAEAQSPGEPGKPISQVLLLDFSSGKIAARLSLSAAPSVVLNDIAECPDGNLLLAGESPGKSGPTPWLGKMGRDGSLLWQKTPSDLGVGAFAQLALGFDNRLVLSGMGRDGFWHLFTCDTAGTLVWKKPLPAADFGPPAPLRHRPQRQHLPGRPNGQNPYPKPRRRLGPPAGRQRKGALAEDLRRKIIRGRQRRGRTGRRQRLVLR